MATDTLPGDLPGLLRRGSPIILQTGAGTARGVVVGPSVDVPGGWEVAWTQVESTGGSILDDCPSAALALDLTDPTGPTGRVHAAWWAWRTWGVGRAESLILPVAAPHITEAEEEVLRAASLGRDFTDAEIATLRALCLRLAGREDV
jgi:hypothetical protein